MRAFKKQQSKVLNLRKLDQMGQSLFGISRQKAPCCCQQKVSQTVTKAMGLQMGQASWPKSEISPLFVSPEHNLGNLPKISESNLSDGVGGNIETIKEMQKVARIRSGHPLIRKLASNILQEYGVKSHHFADEALAIGDFVQRKVRYLRDPDNVEYLQDPLILVEKIKSGSAQGDCDDMALFVATLLLSVGCQPSFRAVRYEQAIGNYNHIYVVTTEHNPYEKPRRIVLDCIMKDKPIGFEVPHMSGDEYVV